MKAKHIKRLEAIERLERKPRLRHDLERYSQEIWMRRLEEAARLRRVFNLPKHPN